MRDGDVERRGREQVAHIVDPDAEQPGPESARRLRRGRGDAGGDVGRGGGIEARRLTDAEGPLDGRRYAPSPDAVERHVDGAVRGDVEQGEFEPPDRAGAREPFPYRWAS